MTRLRAVNSNDKELLRRWRNDPEIYRYTKSGRGVTREEHDEWFRKVLVEQDMVYVVEDGDVPVGHLRFDRLPHSRVISLYLSPGARGRGIGTEAMKRGLEQCECRGVKLLLAEVVEDNVVSLAFFRKLGFEGKKDDKGYWRLFRRLG